VSDSPGGARRGSRATQVVVLFLLLLADAGRAVANGSGWRILGAGVEYATFDLGEGAHPLQVVRIDTDVATLDARFAEQEPGDARTAGAWSRDYGFAAAINLGMFRPNRRNAGYARNGDRELSPRWVSSFKAAIGFAPRRDGLPGARMIDLDTTQERLEGFGVVIQNLRLLKSPGRNVWSRQEKRWSEAAIASDRSGRVLFLFTRSAFPIWELNQKLVRLPLAIDRAMHVEGGPEASLSIHAGGVDLDLAGSYETGFNEDDDNSAQWAIPNVIGVIAGKPGSISGCSRGSSYPESGPWSARWTPDEQATQRIPGSMLAGPSFGRELRRTALAPGSAASLSGSSGRSRQLR